METINEVQDEIIEEFSGFDDWMDKYQLLIDMGSGQEPLPEEYKTEQNLIDGCQSRVWLQADYREGRVVFRAESDALIVKGIVDLSARVSETGWMSAPGWVLLRVQVLRWVWVLPRYCPMAQMHRQKAQREQEIRQSASFS